MLHKNQSFARTLVFLWCSLNTNDLITVTMTFTAVIYILLHETFRTRYVDEYGWYTIEGGTAVAGIVAIILFLIVRKNNINGKRVDGNR